MQLPQFDIADPKSFAQTSRLVEQRGGDLRVVPAQPTVHAIWNREQDVTSAESADLEKREDAPDVAPGKRDEVMGNVTEDLFDQLLPCGQVKKRAVGRRRDKAIPGAFARGRVRTDRNDVHDDVTPRPAGPSDGASEGGSARGDIVRAAVSTRGRTARRSAGSMFPLVMERGRHCRS